jgi:hypothetical protein
VSASHGFFNTGETIHAFLILPIIIVDASMARPHKTLACWSGARSWFYTGGSLAVAHPWVAWTSPVLDLTRFSFRIPVRPMLMMLRHMLLPLLLRPWTTVVVSSPAISPSSSSSTSSLRPTTGRCNKDFYNCIHRAASTTFQLRLSKKWPSVISRRAAKYMSERGLWVRLVALAPLVPLI